MLILLSAVGVVLFAACSGLPSKSPPNRDDEKSRAESANGSNAADCSGIKAYSNVSVRDPKRSERKDSSGKVIWHQESELNDKGRITRKVEFDEKGEKYRIRTVERNNDKKTESSVIEHLKSPSENYTQIIESKGFGSNIETEVYADGRKNIYSNIGNEADESYIMKGQYYKNDKLIREFAWNGTGFRPSKNEYGFILKSKLEQALDNGDMKDVHSTNYDCKFEDNNLTARCDVKGVDLPKGNVSVVGTYINKLVTMYVEDENGNQKCGKFWDETYYEGKLFDPNGVVTKEFSKKYENTENGKYNSIEEVDKDVAKKSTTKNIRKFEYDLDGRLVREEELKDDVPYRVETHEY
ncbi:MAG: hypothetical protein NTV34_02000 [Proteobacteria bacterium]|nr:hypothetical protein [Pseudomonadota bacterium]